MAREQLENKELKKYFVELEVGNEIWIDSLHSNLYRATGRTFILSLYDAETDKYISHTTVTLV